MKLDEIHINISMERDILIIMRYRGDRVIRIREFDIIMVVGGGGDRIDRIEKSMRDVERFELILVVNVSEVTSGDVVFPFAKADKNDISDLYEVSFFISASKFASNVTDYIG